MGRSKWPNKRVKGESNLLKRIQALQFQVEKWHREAAAESDHERKAGKYLALLRTKGELHDAKHQLARLRIKLSKPQQPTLY